MEKRTFNAEQEPLIKHRNPLLLPPPINAALFLVSDTFVIQILALLNTICDFGQLYLTYLNLL